MKNRFWKKVIVAVTAMCMIASVTEAAGVDVYAASPAKKAVKAAEKDSKDTAKGVKMDDAESKLCGDWTYMCEESVYFYGDEVDDTYFGMYELDEDYDNIGMCIYQDGDTLRADYIYVAMESNFRMYGVPLEITKGAMYDGCANEEWYAQLNERWKDTTERTLTLVGENVLEYRTVFTAEDDDYYSYATTYTFTRKGSKEEKDKDAFRYLNTVTVSSAEELLEAVADRTKIVLVDGVYDFSDIDEDSIKNDKVSAEYPGEVAIHDVSQLCITAAEDADVLLCTDDPYARVFSIIDCNSVFLSNLTMGHDVEPGYCSGSVLYLKSSSIGSIDNCDLYGCGTYGLEMLNASDFTINQSNIHDCTYGLVDMRSCYSVEYNDCSFTDSEEFAMFSIYDCYTVHINDSLITRNYSEPPYSAFIEAEESGGVVFTGCTFKDNTYDEFYRGEVEIVDCSVDDN